jgi:hypothetical protein
MLALLLLTTLSLPPQTQVLILRTGDRMNIEGAITEANGRVVFHIKGGSLYSLPAAEIDADATRALALAPPPPPDDGKKKLKVTGEERERLIKELEKNHTGKSVPTPPVAPVAGSTPEAAPLPPPPPPAAPEEAAAKNDEEWRWRRAAREHDEAVRQAKENLELLLARVDRLKGEIAGLIALGFRPRQFTYQTSELQYAQDQVPAAQLEVTRAQRANEQFREDARRQGILPGWLR